MLRIMGHAKANEMLMFDRKFSCSEAHEAGLVSEVIAAADEDAFSAAVAERAAKIVALPPGAVADMKALIRDREREELHAVNERETALLEQRWQSEEFMGAAMAFLSRKQK